MENANRRNELLQKASELSGRGTAEIGKLCFSAAWNVARLETALEEYPDNWLETLTVAAEQGERDRWADAAERILADGPIALAKLSRRALRAIVPPSLGHLADTWTRLHGGVLVVGPTGAGKSVGAAYTAIRVKLAERDTKVHWACAWQLGRARQQHPLGEGEPPLVARALSADVLFLDDLGWEPAADQTVREIWMARYDAGRVTVATSGLTLPELTTRYGAAIVRRFSENRGESSSLYDLFPKGAA